MNYALFEDFLRGGLAAVAVAGHDDVHALEWLVAYHTSCVHIVDANYLTIAINEDAIDSCYNVAVTTQVGGINHEVVAWLATTTQVSHLGRTANDSDETVGLTILQSGSTH